MPTESDTPAARLRAARESLGLSLARAAEMVGVEKSTYIQYENGRRKPTLDNLHRIATAWGIDPADLDAKLASNKPK